VDHYLEKCRKFVHKYKMLRALLKSFNHRYYSVLKLYVTTGNT